MSGCSISAVPLDEIAALDVLLRRAQDAGAVRPEVRTADLLALFEGLLAALQAATEEDSRELLLAVVTDDLRAP